MLQKGTTFTTLAPSPSTNLGVTELLPEVISIQKIDFVREQNTAGKNLSQLIFNYIRRNVQFNFFLGIKACQDVKDVLEMLKIKAVTKIRAYIIEQISKLRRPMTNYHMPQNALLKHKYIIKYFLEDMCVEKKIIYCNLFSDRSLNSYLPMK